MTSDYEIIDVLWKFAGFTIPIVRIKEESINNKLAILSNGSGRIKKEEYNKFLAETCLVDQNRIFSIFEHVNLDDEQLAAAANELRDLIIRVNPLLDPELLIINEDNLIRLPEQSDPPEIRKLVDNPIWNEPPDAPDNKSEITMINNMFLSSMLNDALGKEHGNVEAVNWERYGIPVAIKKHTKQDLVKIFSGSPEFSSDAYKYKVFLVTKCVVDYHHLFALLDQIADGTDEDVPMSELISELYDMCIGVNPFLSWENLDHKKIERIKTKERSRSAGACEKTEETGDVIYLEDIEKEKILTLADRMKEKLVGQDSSVDVIAETVQIAYNNLKEPDPPIGVFLMCGRTGVGKTYAAKVLAEELCGKFNMIRFDCSEYGQSHEVSKLIGCFVPGTQITMEGGLVKKIEDIKVGEKVISGTGNLRKVKDTFEYDYSGPLYNIKIVNDNRTIKCTPNHEFLVIRHSKCDYKDMVCKPTCAASFCKNRKYLSYKPEWVSAKNLAPRDIVLQPKYKSNYTYEKVLDLSDFYSDAVYNNKYIWTKKRGISGENKINRFIKINRDFARLAGYYVAEGGVDKHSINFSFHTDEEVLQKEVEDLIFKIFGKKTSFKRSEKERIFGVKRKRCYIHSIILARFFESLFGAHGDKNKRLPTWWLDLPDDLLYGFLETAILGDGTKAKRFISYASVSPNLSSQMRGIITKLGFISTLWKKNVKKVYGKKAAAWNDIYVLGVGGGQINKFSSKCPNLCIDLSNIKSRNRQKCAYTDADFIYKEIKDISRVAYTGKVHDLHIDKDMSYQVLEIIAHNSPSGYVGYEDGGQLTNFMKEKPFSVILFDEVEKAHGKLHDMLLAIMDEGRLTSGKGEIVHFDNAIILMTSNVGVREVDNIEKTISFNKEAYTITDDKQSKAIRGALKSKFKPEFLNRIDRVLVFDQLGKESCKKIVSLQIDSINSWLKPKELSLEVDQDVKDYILDGGFDKDFGARPLKRFIRKNLVLPMSNLLIKSEVLPGSVVMAHLDKTKIKSEDETAITFEIKSPVAKKPVRRRRRTKKL